MSSNLETQSNIDPANFLDEDHYDQKEFIINKFEFIRVLDETSYFLKEIVNRKDVGENRPLHLAVEQNYLNLVGLLFKYGAMAILHSANRNLPIHIAAKNGSTDMFDLLEQHNAISFKSNTEMENLFHISVGNNNVEFLKIACDHYKRKFHAFKYSKEFKHAFDSVNSGYLTPLFLAVSKSNTECVEILMQMRTGLKYHTDDYGRNLFHICAIFNSHHTFKFLVEEIERQKDEKILFQERGNKLVVRFCSLYFIFQI